MGKQKQSESEISEEEESDFESGDEKKISLNRKNTKKITKKKNTKTKPKSKKSEDLKKKNSVPKTQNQNKQKLDKKTEVKPKPQKKKEESSENKTNHSSEKETFLIGQKYPTPPDGDGTRAFYESLLEQKPESKMAEKWCLEYGLLDPEKANIVFNKLKKEKNSHK